MTYVINKSTVDPFTFVHLGAGVLAHRAGVTLPQTLFLGIFWDFYAEPELKSAYPGAFPYPSQDAPVHAVIDALVPALGWMLDRWWTNSRASCAN